MLCHHRLTLNEPQTHRLLPWLLQHHFCSWLLWKYVYVHKMNSPLRGCWVLIREVTKASRKQGGGQQAGSRKEWDGSVISQPGTIVGQRHCGSCWALAAGLMPKDSTGGPECLPTHPQATELHLSGSGAVHWCSTQWPSLSPSIQPLEDAHSDNRSCFSPLSSCPPLYFCPTSMQESRYLLCCALLWTSSVPVSPVTRELKPPG